MSQTVVATTIVLREKLLKPPYLNLKKKGSGMGAMLFSHLDRLVESVSIATNYTMPSRDKKGCNIQEVMEELNSIHGVDFGSPIHTFATEFFYARSKKGDVEILTENTLG
jgi:hypothetical protein